mmetsp:Transcript_18140/g.32502  ORF Transcript_18140/g.32502 Transcript_18140/m.32502 type:complete len:260 (+) Transcript_18140:114-893(+)
MIIPDTFAPAVDRATIEINATACIILKPCPIRVLASRTPEQIIRFEMVVSIFASTHPTPFVIAGVASHMIATGYLFDWHSTTGTRFHIFPNLIKHEGCFVRSLCFFCASSPMISRIAIPASCSIARWAHNLSCISFSLEDCVTVTCWAPTLLFIQSNLCVCAEFLVFGQDILAHTFMNLVLSDLTSTTRFRTNQLHNLPVLNFGSEVSRPAFLTIVVRAFGFPDLIRRHTVPANTTQYFVASELWLFRVFFMFAHCTLI